VRRILALGNLLPRIRTLYRDGDLDMVSVRHLTMASKSQQRDWLAAYDDPDTYAPMGHGLKAWLFGGQSISAMFALFNIRESGLDTVADLFGEDRYFSDIAGFWTAQNAAIADKREALLADGWGEVVIVPPTEHFQTWEYEKRAKRKGGRVYLDVRANGEVIAHEGYVSRREAERQAKAGAIGQDPKPTRGELTSALATYVDLHRHAAARAKLLDHPQMALRLLAAHLISPTRVRRATRRPPRASMAVGPRRCSPSAARRRSRRSAWTRMTRLCSAIAASGTGSSACSCGCST